MNLVIYSQSEAETEAFGRALGHLLRPGDVLALIGNLGAGKTCLTRGIAAGLDVAEPITSPTFILVAEYQTPRGFVFFHADCYRFGDAIPEAVDIGLDELMNGRGVLVVEWAERVEALLPADHLRVTLTAPTYETRRLLLEATGPRSQAIVDGLAASH